MVTCMPCKHKVLSSSLMTHIFKKKPSIAVYTCNPRALELLKGATWGSLAVQISLRGELQARVSLSQKSRWYLGLLLL